MLKEKRWLIKFFLIHLCLIIPMMLMSILAVGMVTDKMKRLENISAEIRLDNVMTNLEENYFNYYKESVLLSESLQLLPRAMLESHGGTREGIKLLKLKRHYDNRVVDVFIDYGTEFVYAASGVASKQVHFDSVLACREESIYRGMEIMEKGERAATFLFKSDINGYLLYSYPTRKVEDDVVSINFVMSFEQVGKILQLMDEKQWYQLQAADGSTLSVACDASGKVFILSEEMSEKRIQSGSYTVIEKDAVSMGMKVRLCYEKFALRQENGIYQMQIINMVLIGAGILLSAVVSWLLSKRRINEIVSLEDIARGEVVSRLPQKNAYNRLQDIIVTRLNESREHTRQLRDQTAWIIFQGMSDNFERLNEQFCKLGFDGCPKRFFVGAFSAAIRPQEDQMPPLLKGCLRVHILHDLLEVVVFLYELEIGDGNQVQRKKIAENIRTFLHQQGISKVRVGMSRVYTDPMMINRAYSESVSVLEQVVSGKIGDYCGCWENAVQDAFFLMPENVVLEDLAQALIERSYDSAEKAFRQLLHSYSVKECTTENRAYIRYTILQQLVEFLHKESTVESMIFLKECLNLSVKDEKKFIQTVENVLKQLLVKKEDDPLLRMLNYVERNYHRSDLSYEEVAAVGGVSRSYISKLFRMKLGVSYIEYLTSVRMDKAGILLRTTDYNVNDIVKMVGYENAANFRKCFKEKYGISATDYRKRESELK